MKAHKNDLRVFVIPSWYPSRTRPSAGIFVRDQVQAVARQRPGWRIVVSVWGQDETVVESRQPISTFRRLRRRDLWSRSEYPEAPNATVFSTPALHWTPRLLSGRFDAILAANRENLLRSRDRFGDFDLIHAHASFPAALLASELASELGIPYVVTEHTGEALRHRVERAQVGRRALGEAVQRASAVIAVSVALARSLGHAGVPPTDIIPNVVDEEFFTPAPRSVSAPRAFALARLVDEKGIVTLIEAAALLRASGFRLDLRIGGDGPRRRRFERHARGLGLAEAVSFLGSLARDAVREEMRACSCFVLPSESESFGVVCVEALACGRPVVATRSGGPEDIVTERDGVLVPPRDAVALAEGLRAVLTQRYDTEGIRTRAVDRFGSATVTAALEAVYLRVLGVQSARAEG